MKRVKKLCKVLEIDHLGLFSEGIKRLKDDYNKYVVRGDVIGVYEIEALKDKGVSKFLESETGKKRIKEILEYPNEKSKAELEALKDQENYETLEAEIKAEREREGG